MALGATLHDGQEEVFAHDFSIFHEFDKRTPIDVVELKINWTRAAVHKWWHQNRVTFDPATEHTVIVHPSFGS